MIQQQHIRVSVAILNFIPAVNTNNVCGVIYVPDEIIVPILISNVLPINGNKKIHSDSIAGMIDAS